MKKKLGFQAFLLRFYVFFVFHGDREREEMGGSFKELEVSSLPHCEGVGSFYLFLFFFNYSDNFRDAEMMMGDGYGSLRWGIRS